MKRLLFTLVIIFFCLPQTVQAGRNPKKPLITVSWRMKYLNTTSHKIKSEKGNARVPLITKKGCLKQFKIKKFSWSMDATQNEKVISAMSGVSSLAVLKIQILKLFDGQGDFPKIVIYTKSGRSINIDFIGMINLTSWLNKYYLINAEFNADGIPLPKFWTKIELICGKQYAEEDKQNNSISSNETEKGRKLHRKILRRHHKIDKFYYRPFLYGELTSNPLIIIAVPANDWNSLSKAKKALLCKYVASLVRKAKESPFRYTRIPSTAPIAYKVKANIEGMTSDSWGIAIGNITSNGCDIELDKIVHCE